MKTCNFILAVIAATLSVTPFSCKKHKTDASHSAPLPVSVDKAVVEPVLLSKAYPGTISAQNSVDVMARVNGTLTAQLFNGGDYVKKGQVLFTIEDTQYRDALAQAQAALSNAESEYQYNTKHYAAMAKALESDAVAQIQVMQAKSAAEQSEAAVKNAKAALQTARTNLDYCTIRAPFDGQMTKGLLSPGSYVAGAGSPIKLSTIYDNKDLYAEFYIDDRAYERSLANHNNRSEIDYDNVPIAFADSLPHSYTGKLVYMAPSVDVTTGTLLLRLDVKNDHGELKNGMYCTVSLPYKYEPAAVMVKDAAISTSQTNKYIYVVNDSNRVEYRTITLGSQPNDSMRIVTSGLKGGETYITQAMLKVRPGMKVAPIDKSSKAK